MKQNQTATFDHENGIMDPFDDVPSSAAEKEMQALIEKYELFEISLLRLEMELEYEAALGASLTSPICSESRSPQTQASEITRNPDGESLVDFASS